MNDVISVEGIILPNQPLTNFEIIDAVYRLQIPNFRGVVTAGYSQLMA
jgi:hypothetical protein